MASRTRISSLDQELLRSLERAFAHHAGEDRLIDAEELQKALNLKSAYLARRVFKAFDRDGNGVIDHDEFFSAVRSLAFGSEAVRLEFAFRLHDDNDDGCITEVEMMRMISISLAESDVMARRSQPPERLARVVFEQADANRDGLVTFDEFARVMGRYPELLQKITRSEAVWMVPNEELLARLTDTPSPSEGRFRRRLENHWIDASFVLGWLAINAVLFATAYLGAEQGPPLLRLGRALASCASFNGALIFVPVLRRFSTWLRHTWLGRRLAVDAAIDVHRFLGQFLFVVAVLHSVAYMAVYHRGHATLGLEHLLTSTWRGSTGAPLLLVFTVMWALSQAPIRRSKRFELFYFSHLLYVVWIALMIAHAPSFLAWAGLPLAWLLVENVSRRRRRAQPTTARASALRSGVTRLEITRPAGFGFEPGDYVFLNVPHLAAHEWHPFTLSSGPQSEDLTVHVRSLGNWTSALRSDVEDRELRGDTDFTVRLDGPYGSPTAHLFAARHAVLIGAGIGVTPFASVLDSLTQRAKADDHMPHRLESVHFFWLNRDQYSFEWFTELLGRIEESPLQHPLHVHICMTGGRDGATSAALEIAREILHGQGKRDLVTGLHSKTYMGHPDWDVVLSAIADEHAPEPVDVFFCGPVGLGRKLRRICVSRDLRFHEEKF